MHARRLKVACQWCRADRAARATRQQEQQGSASTTAWLQPPLATEAAAATASHRQRPLQPSLARPSASAIKQLYHPNIIHINKKTVLSRSQSSLKNSTKFWGRKIGSIVSVGHHPHHQQPSSANPGWLWPMHSQRLEPRINASQMKKWMQVHIWNNRGIIFKQMDRKWQVLTWKWDEYVRKWNEFEETHGHSRQRKIIEASISFYPKLN